MIHEIQIKNYKSIQNLKLEVGRFNTFIGENGCGKSNFLEAITLAAAADAGMLDNQFLSSRGIRVTAPELMRSAFEKSFHQEPVEIFVKYSGFEEINSYTLGKC